MTDSTRMNCSVRPYHDSDRAAWDRYVEQHPYGSPFHLIAWKNCMQATFGYTPMYLVAESTPGHLCGILPLFLIRNFLQGAVLVSSPFAVYGGVLASADDARNALADEVRALATRFQVQHVELRNSHPEQCCGFDRIARYATFTQALHPVDGETLLAEIPKKTRNLIRKALKNPFQSRIATNLDAFYGLLADTYRRLGTPLFPRSHFENILREFGPLADVREVFLEDKLAAVSLNFLFRGEMHTYYAASNQDLLSLAPNNFLYYDHILWACQNGYRSFDFGRSKYDTGNFDFKKHWATEIRDLPYEMLLVRRKTVPDFTPKNESFGRAIQIWRKLPLPVTKALGPFLIRLFP